jgi:hypothetical protein
MALAAVGATSMRFQIPLAGHPSTRLQSGAGRHGVDTLDLGYRRAALDQDASSREPYSVKTGPGLVWFLPARTVAHRTHPWAPLDCASSDGSHRSLVAGLIASRSPDPHGCGTSASASITFGQADSGEMSTKHSSD